MVAQAAAADVGAVVQLFRQRGAHEDFRGVLGVNHGRRLGLVEGHRDWLPDGRQRHHQAADHAGHSGDAPVAEHGADADTPQVQTVQVGVAPGGEVVDRLGHAVDVDGVVDVILVDGPLAEGVLHAIDRDGAGVHHPFDASPPRGLEHVVGAADVHLHGEVGPVFGVGRQQRRHVDDARHPVGVDGLHQLRELRHVAAVEADTVQVWREIGPRRSEVEAHDLFATLQ